MSEAEHATFRSQKYGVLRVDGEETVSNRRDRETNPELYRERQRCQPLL